MLVKISTLEISVLLEDKKNLYNVVVHQVLKRIENLWYIAETSNSVLRTGIDYITGFLSLYFFADSLELSTDFR
jgi:hypothetical protein